jgi:hypothetical protein
VLARRPLSNALARALAPAILRRCPRLRKHPAESKGYPLKPTPDIFAGRAALAIAHPGHELRVHGWVQRATPLVLVLTDGSGRSGSPRLATTERIVRDAGARPGGLFGRVPDRQIYQAVLSGDAQLFLDLAVVVALELVRNQIEVVVGDAAEGTILTHDLWRGIVNRAVWLATQSLGHSMRNYEFPLGDGPRTIPKTPTAEALTYRLSDAELAGKIAAARSYQGLSREVEWAISSAGEEALRCEILSPAKDEDVSDLLTPPSYEEHGEQQVAAGVYSQVVRYHQHVLPILRTLRRGRTDFDRRQPREAA